MSIAVSGELSSAHFTTTEPGLTFTTDLEKGSHWQADSSENAKDWEDPFADFHQVRLSIINIQPSFPIPKPRSRLDKLKDALLKEVDPHAAAIPLTLYCFITGYLDAITFSTIFVWCAFQTGNTVQLSLALARQIPSPIVLNPLETLIPSEGFHASDKHALMSLCTFLLGVCLIRYLDTIPYNALLFPATSKHQTPQTLTELYAINGRTTTTSKSAPKSCLSFATGTFIQSLMTFLAALFISANPGEEWAKFPGYMGLGLISASMGLQSVMAKRLNTHFGTTIVLTSVWTDLAASCSITFPSFTSFSRSSLSSWRFHKSTLSNIWRATVQYLAHDPFMSHKLLAVLSLFVGGFAGRAICGQVGDAGAIAIAGAIRFGVAVGWLFVRAKA